MGLIKPRLNSGKGGLIKREIGSAKLHGDKECRRAGSNKTSQSERIIKMAAGGAVLNIARLINAAELSALIAKTGMGDAVGEANPVGAN